MEFNKYEELGDYHWQEYEVMDAYGKHAERVKDWIKEKKVLDIGAGDGLITSLIGAIGIDNNKIAPKLAQKHNVKVLYASTYNIPFADDSFEAVFMGDVIEHLADEQSALHEIKRVLNDRGYLYITTPPAKDDKSFHDKYHYREYTESDLASIVKECGFLCVDSFIDKDFFNIYAKFQKVKNIFNYDYDVNSIQKIIIKRFGFEIFVTPRFIDHYSKQSYEEFTSDLVNNYAKNIDLFIDVGAHYGYFSLLVGQSNPDCKIIAFEPVPENFEILKRNLELNHLTNAEAINQAVSNKHAREIFNISTASDNCSFIQHPATPILRQIEVQSVSLSEVLIKNKNTRILIKIDTDGHELQVLEGLEDILRESDNIAMILEFNPKCCYPGGSTPETLLNKLNLLGYDCFFLDDQEHRLYQPADGGVNSWKSILGGHSWMNLLCKKRNISTNALFFSHSSLLAGAERSLLELVKELTSEHDTLCTVVLPSQGPLESLLQKAGAATLVAPINFWCAGAELPDDTDISKLYSQSFGWLNKNLPILNQINPDVVLTNTLVIPWGALAAYLLKRPHIWMVNEFGELDHGLKFFLPFDRILGFIDSSSDKIVTRSQAIQTALFPHQDSKKVNTIYRYIDISDTNSISKVSKDNYFKLPDACHLIISGTVMKSKGQEDAVRSMIELVKIRNRRVELVIVGSAQPEFQNYLQEIINSEGVADCIHFIPFHENVLSIVNAADIVLVCSRMEAFGRVILEAMLMEKAVIATNTGGTPEMIINEETGLLYTPGNYLQLADQIEQLLDNPDKRKKLAQNAYHFAKSTFTREDFGGAYHKILADLKNKEFQNKEDSLWFLTTQYQILFQTLTAQVAEREQTVQTLTAQVAEREQTVQTLTVQVAEGKEEILHYAMSKSWRITRPFRKITRFVRDKKNA